MMNVEETRKVEITSSELLRTLHIWAEKGWLRRLDTALAAFMLELDPSVLPALLASVCILAHMEGRGHTCLPIQLLAAEPNEFLAWPDAAQEDVKALWETLPAKLADWLLALQSSQLVCTVMSGQMDGGDPAQTIVAKRGQPLVLCGTLEQPLLYLRRYWLHEQRVAHELQARTAFRQSVDEHRVRQWLDQLFDSTGTEPATAEMDWQKLACAVALRAKLTVITGGPGTGKTYTAARLLTLLFAMSDDPQRLRVALAAPTGKAAARLRQSIDSSLQELGGRLGATLDLEALTMRIGAAKTLHALLGARLETRAFSFNASHPLDVDILIVDEASMVHLEMMSALMQAMPPNARLVLLGDKDQLASVEAGAVLGDLCRDAELGHYSQETQRYASCVTGQTIPAMFLAKTSAASALAQQTVMLRRSRRFGGLIGQLAMAVNAGQGLLAQQVISNDSTLTLHSSNQASVATVLNLATKGRKGAPSCYADYLELINAKSKTAVPDTASHEAWVKRVLVAFDRFRILCAVHDGDLGTVSLNLGVQKALADAGLLAPRNEWFAGRPVMVTRNDPQLGVFNGDVGVALPGLNTAALRVYFLDGDNLRSVGVARLAHVETAFAITVHKSQGSEFLHTALVLPKGNSKVATRELVYTGITRARENFTLIEGQEGLLRRAIEHQTLRASGLAALLIPPDQGA